MGRRLNSWIGIVVALAAVVGSSWTSHAASPACEDTAELPAPSAPVAEGDSAGEPSTSPFERAVNQDAGPSDIPGAVKPAAETSPPPPKKPSGGKWKAETRPASSLPDPAPKVGGDPAEVPGEPPVPAELPAKDFDPMVEPSQATGTLPTRGKPLVPVPGPGQKPPVRVAQAADAAASTPAPAPASAPVPEEKPRFTLPAESLPLGRQSIGLTVDVVAPQSLNLNHESTLKIVVKNNGVTDAHGVIVRDELPPKVEFLSSQPEARRIDSLLTWNLETVPAGSERIITLKVKAVQVGPFDHAATVTMMAGGKSRTTVLQPKLKVEQSVPSTKVLRGQSVPFSITVSNPGTGPVRNVTVLAKLSSGLRHESGGTSGENLFEQTIDLLEPGQSQALETLIADAFLGGQQSCRVVAQSDDVTPPSPEADNVLNLTVIEPRLSLKINGPEKRYADTIATYDIQLENPGTAPARNVRIQASIPVSGVLYAIPTGAQWDSANRRISWTRPHLDAGEKATLSFQVRMGGFGLYKVPAEAKADGVPVVSEFCSTQVETLADVNFDVSERRRIVDVDGTTEFVIRVVNSGSKAATGLLVSAVLSDNVVPIETLGTDEGASYSKKENKVMFPVIDRLGNTKPLELAIRVKATKPGDATCRVQLVHDDLSQKTEVVASFKIVPIRR